MEAAVDPSVDPPHASLSIFSASIIRFDNYAGPDQAATFSRFSLFTDSRFSASSLT
jgi:hypothetical protein